VTIYNSYPIHAIVFILYQREYLPNFSQRLALSYEGVSPHLTLPTIPSVCSRCGQVGSFWLLRILQVSQNEARVCVERKDRLSPDQLDERISGVRTFRRCRRQGSVVDGYGMVSHYELDVGLFCGNDLPHPFRPHRAVHEAQTLHLSHELQLAQRGVARLDPVQALGGSQLLSVQVLEEVLERVVHRARVSASKGANCPGSPYVNGAEEVLLDFVVHHRAEVRGVEVVLVEAVLRPPFVQGVHGHCSAIRQHLLLWRGI